MKNHMAKNKETSTRRAGKGQKPSSGTRDQLIKDLQRVHKVFPTAEPDHDFHRVNTELAVGKVEHLLLVLKLMQNDPQGDHTSIPSTDPKKILHGRWQIVVSDLYSIVDALNEALLPKGTKLIFDTEEFADVEVKGVVR